jgi:hypothetical protein
MPCYDAAAYAAKKRAVERAAAEPPAAQATTKVKLTGLTKICKLTQQFD